MIVSDPDSSIDWLLVEKETNQTCLMTLVYASHQMGIKSVHVFFTEFANYLKSSCFTEVLIGRELLNKTLILAFLRSSLLKEYTSSLLMERVDAISLGFWLVLMALMLTLIFVISDWNGSWTCSWWSPLLSSIAFWSPGRVCMMCWAICGMESLTIDFLQQVT